MLMAFILYLDRICMGEIVKSVSFNQDLESLEGADRAASSAAFFFAYALFQVPAGWASDRFGARPMLTIYIVLWSLFTIMTGLVNGFVGLLLARLLCGMAEAGAYPTSAGPDPQMDPAHAARAGQRHGGARRPHRRHARAVSHHLDDRRTGQLAGLAVDRWLRGPRHRGDLLERGALESAGASRVNAAELALIGMPPPEKRLERTRTQSALWSFTHSRSLWCNAAEQLLTNIGWVFLVTWLPTYLVQERGVGQVEGGRMVTYVLAFGMLGQIAGGYFCDWATRRLGRRWGRVLPMSQRQVPLRGARMCAAPSWSRPGCSIACCAVVSFCTDLANPARWAFMGDVGGRATAAAGGWGNMWGNFGASAGAMLVPWLIAHGGGDGKKLVFFTLAGAFALAGLVVLPMDATKKLLPDEPAAGKCEIAPAPGSPFAIRGMTPSGRPSATSAATARRTPRRAQYRCHPP